MESYKSEIAKLIERGFRKARPKDQIETINTLNKITPVKQEYRDRPSDVRRIPIEQEIKNKEYEEYFKEYKKQNKENKKLLRDRTV